jgi:hypothetical protein
MSVNAAFVGVFDGDSKAAYNGAYTRVKVQAQVVGKMFGSKRHSGHVALYKPSQRAVYGSAVGPNKHNECLYFQVQFHARGHWGYGGTTQCVTLNQHSAAAVYLQGSSQLAGIPVRMRAIWRGDSLNTGGKAPWSLSEFTGSAKSRSRAALSKLGSGYSLVVGTRAPALSAPKIRTPFSQHTARSQSSPSSSLANPFSWVS